MGEISDELVDTEGRKVDQRMNEHRRLLAMERRRLAIELLASETPFVRGVIFGHISRICCQRNQLPPFEKAE